MAPSSHPVCSPGSANHAPVLCLQLSSTPCFSTLRDQAPDSTSLLSFVSDAAVFPGPLLPKDCGFDPLRASGGGSHQQWPNEQWPNGGCAQERLPDPAGAGAPRLRPGVSPPQKSSRDSVAAAFQGLWAPGFTLNDLVPAPANVAAFRGLLRPGGLNSLYQMSFRQWNRFSRCGLRTSRTPLCSWGFALPTRAPPGMSCGVAAFALPWFTVLMEFKPSPFSLFPF